MSYAFWYWLVYLFVLISCVGGGWRTWPAEPAGRRPFYFWAGWSFFLLLLLLIIGLKLFPHPLDTLAHD